MATDVYWDTGTKRYQIGTAPAPRSRPVPRVMTDESAPAPIPGGGLTFDRSSGEYRRNGYRMPV